MNLNAIVDAGGTITRQPDSTHKVNFWYIPGGARYDRAQVIDGFFNDKAVAEQFAAKYSVPPEMAMCIELEKAK